MDAAEVLGWARKIDASRLRGIPASPPPTLEQALGLLLSAAFPLLAPYHEWQKQALAGMARTILNPRSRQGIRTACMRAADPTSADFAIKLRRQVWAEKARIALRELLPTPLGGPDVDETARELSHLADAVLDLTLQEAEHWAQQRYGAPLDRVGNPSRMVVFGMGKLGGQELNAGSDIDIVFVYDTDEGQSQVSLNEHWTAVAQRMVATIEEMAEGGPMFRVDLRLRPEGSRGALVNSVTAIERYYETWGRPWERAVWLRARPCAGETVLGETLEHDLFTGFVYPRAIDPAIATTLAEMIERSRREARGDVREDLKLGVGGIREAEFFVQSLQLVWGGAQPVLRKRGTLEALAVLCSEGLITDHEARDVEHAYLVLRRVEHRVQWSSGVQTHSLPRDEQDRERIARSLGYGGYKQMAQQLEHVRARVHRLFLSVLPREPAESKWAELIAELDSHEPLRERSDDVAGEVDVQLREHLRSLARRPDGLLGERTRDQFPRLTDEVLDKVYAASDPEQAARYLSGYFGKLAAPGVLIRPLAEKPVALGRLVTILGASAFVGDALMASPDLADIILFGAGQLADVNPREIVAQELQNMRRDLPADADKYDKRDAFMAALRRAKGKVTVDVAAADLAGLLEPRQVTRLLSDLADEILDRAVRFELGGKTKGLCVIAVGKLGGRDIGYGSDLDVLFIYDPASAPRGKEASSYYARAAQRVIGVISEAHWAGAGYELDTRLRPSGSQGLLVTSLLAFARYHRVQLPGSIPAPNDPQVFTSGAAWERQALLRARFAAGDKALGKRLIEIAQQAAYEQGPPPVAEMHRLRLRMQHELAQEGDGRFDLKVGRGGLLDVEFACQWLQMRYGADNSVRTTDSVEALAALHEAGHLDEDTFRELSEGYKFLRQLEQRMRVLHGTGTTVIDTRQAGLPQLARRMGLHQSGDIGAVELLIARYQAVTASVREAYLRVLGLQAAAGPED